MSPPNEKTIDHYRILALQNLMSQLPGVVIVVVTVHEDEASGLASRKFSANVQSKDALGLLFSEIGAGVISLRDDEVVDLTDVVGGMQ